MTTPRRGVRVLVPLAVLALGAGALTPPAAADPSTPAVTRHVTPTGIVATTAVAEAASVSLYSAGYRVTTEGTTVQLRATVVVPEVDCDAAPRARIGVNVGLFGRARDTEDFDLVVAGLDVTCSEQFPRQTVFTGAAPVFISALRPVRPGQAVTFVLTSSPTASTATVLDANGRRLSAVRDTGIRVDDADLLVQDDGAGVPRRSTHPPVVFSAVTVDAAPLIRAAPERVVQRTTDGRPLAVPSAFTPDGAGFTVRRVRG